jgi:hypothetical protein
MKNPPELPGLRCVVETIAREQRYRNFEALRSLWRIGDALLGLQRLARARSWRHTLEECARCLGVAAASLDDALRAARAFPPMDRDVLLRSFEEARAAITQSHVVELARVAPRPRARGIEELLRAPHSTRDLRCKLRVLLRETISESTGPSYARLDKRDRTL